MKDEKTEFVNFFSELLALISRYDKNDIKIFRAIIERMGEDKNLKMESRDNIRKSTKRRGRDVKVNIIGGLPTLLLSKKYFPYNLDISNFAEKYLDIKIPQPEKKSREELIGRVISKVAQLNERELDSFNIVLNKVLGKVEEGKVDNFFLEWDVAIRNLKFK